MVGIESCEVGRQEGHPHKESRRHGDENVPGLVEVIRQLSSEESI